MPDAAAALRALAKHYGVARSWRAWDGSRRVVADDSLIAVLSAMGVGIERPADAPDVLAATRADQLATPIDAVHVLWDGAPLRIQIRLPAPEASSDFTLCFELEDGQTSEHSRRDCRVGAPRRDGMTHVITVVEPPVRVPFGVHRLVYRRPGAPDATATIIAAPSQLRERAPGDQRRWGVFEPLYALHDTDRPVGDYALLDRMAEWAAVHGADSVGTLPLLATFVGAGREPTTLSPYSPVSRRWWNETYIDAGALPERDGRAVASDRLDGIDVAGRRVDLAAVARARRAVLEAAAAAVTDRPARRDAMEAWCRDHPEVEAYARFRASVERDGPGADATRVAADDPAVQYHRYVQWVAAGQLQALAHRLGDRRQRLYLDLPLGTHADGFDVHAHPGLFVRRARIGAPPDEFNRAGQDWGAPPVLPSESRVAGHAEFRAAVRAHLDVAGMLRVDHVMGLHRLWWLPAGASAADGAYVQYPADELYAVLCLEADRGGALIVGENLGTVPHETNRALQAHRMLGMFLVPFELGDDGLAPPGRRTLAALDTHDTPTFAQWWHDLPLERRELLLGSLDDTEHGADTRAEPTVIDPDAPLDDVLAAILGHLGASRAEIVLVALDDLWLDSERHNDPSAGDDSPRPNFALRAACSLDELETDERARRLVERLVSARRHGLVGV
jgi:4-alpha-glucanotransferase